MGEKYILAFRLSSRFDDTMSPESVFDAHYFHHFDEEKQKQKTRKMLFTTKTQIAQDKKDNIGQVILIPKGGRRALLAKAVRFETYEQALADGYEVPSQWKYEEQLSRAEQAAYNKYGLYNIEFLKEKDLEKYVNSTTQLSLLDSISGQNHRIYVKVMDVE